MSFDIEGVEDLAAVRFSTDAVEVNAAAGVGGKVKFTVMPKGEVSAKVAVYHFCVFLI